MLTPLLLLVSDRLSGTFTGSRIGLGALAAYREAFSVADSAVAVGFDEALDVHSDFATEFTFYGVVVFDFITELRDIVFGQVLCSLVRINAGLCENVACALGTDTIDVGKSYLYTFCIRNVNTGNTCHLLFTFLLKLTLSLLVLGIFADNHYVTMTLDDLALFADFLYGRLYFHSILPPFFFLLSHLRNHSFLVGLAPKSQLFVRHVILPLDGS